MMPPDAPRLRSPATHSLGSGNLFETLQVLRVKIELQFGRIGRKSLRVSVCTSAAGYRRAYDA